MTDTLIAGRRGKVVGGPQGHVHVGGKDLPGPLPYPFRHHAQAHRCFGTITISIANGVGKAIGSLKSSIGRVGDGPIGIGLGHAAGGITHGSDRESVAFRVCIVGKWLHHHW